MTWSLTFISSYMGTAKDDHECFEKVKVSEYAKFTQNLQVTHCLHMSSAFRLLVVFHALMIHSIQAPIVTSD